MINKIISIKKLALITVLFDSANSTPFRFPRYKLVYCEGFLTKPSFFMKLKLNEFFSTLAIKTNEFGKSEVDEEGMNLKSSELKIPCLLLVSSKS
jgi:hypothetical protein